MSEARRTISVDVNGQLHRRAVETRVTLVDFLRHDLRLTGSHVGCEHGACGACTVLVDGLSVRGCLMLAVQADGCAVETVEGLAGPEGVLNPLQGALREYHGLQCGFCTPGILMTMTELLRDNPFADEEAVRDTLGGNICRCTGYQGIVDAVLSLTKGNGAPVKDDAR